MSRHRSRGLQVGIALSVAASTALAVTAYWFWQGKVRAEEQLQRANQEREQTRKAHMIALDRLNAAKQRISRLSDLDFDQFLAAADDDIRQYGGGLQSGSYADVVRHLQNLLDAERTELKQLIADKDRLQQDYQVVESIKQVAVNTATVATHEARDDLLHERTEFHRQLAGKDSELAAIFDRANTLAAKLETEKRDKATIREQLLGEVNKLRKILTEARAPFTPDALAKQKPDGKVIRSSAATKTVWINVGSKDGVEPQLTFSVQPEGFPGNPFTKPKAKLEVVKVTSADMSEARILEASRVDPVVEGDLIFNPAWNPGKVTRFALAGLLDIDGDGVDDRERVRKMIEIARAKIDAELLPDGTERGQVSVETNYYVRGVRPDPEKAGPLDLRVLSAMAKMERTALDYGAVVIDLSKFLDLLGYAAPSRGEAAVAPRLTPGENPGTRVSLPSGSRSR